jgi:hypothetical protein
MGFDFFGIEITYDIAAIITMHHIPVTIELPPGAEEAEEVPELPF